LGIDDVMAQVLWTRHFLLSQGDQVPTTTKLLAENGKASNSNSTNHVEVRYFFVTDKIKKGEVKVG